MEGKTVDCGKENLMARVTCPRHSWYNLAAVHSSHVDPRDNGKYRENWSIYVTSRTERKRDQYQADWFCSFGHWPFQGRFNQTDERPDRQTVARTNSTRQSAAVLEYPVTRLMKRCGIYLQIGI